MDKNTMNVYSPESHIWMELKRPRKGTCCEICSATDKLMAYRLSCMKQTVCKRCLNKAKRNLRRRKKCQMSHKR